MELLARFRDHLRSLGLPPGPVLVAVSGGADSVALLDLLVPDAGRPWPRAGRRPRGPRHPSRQRGGGRAGGQAGRGARGRVPSSKRPAWARTPARPRRARPATGCCSRWRIASASGPSSRPITRTIRSRPSCSACWAARVPRDWRGWPRLPAGWFARFCHFAARSWRGTSRSGATGSLARPGQPGLGPSAELAPAGAAPDGPSRLPEADAHLARVGALAARDRRAWDRLLDHLPDLDTRTEGDGISVAANCLRSYDSTLARRCSWPWPGASGARSAPRGRPARWACWRAQRAVGGPGTGVARRAGVRSVAAGGVREVSSSVELRGAEGQGRVGSLAASLADRARARASGARWLHGLVPARAARGAPVVARRPGASPRRARSSAGGALLPGCPGSPIPPRGLAGGHRRRIGGVDSRRLPVRRSPSFSRCGGGPCRC